MRPSLFTYIHKYTNKLVINWQFFCYCNMCLFEVWIYIGQLPYNTFHYYIFHVFKGRKERKERNRRVTRWEETRGPKWSCIAHLITSQLWVKWPFGSREVQYWFSRWRPFLISSQNDFCYFWSTSVQIYRYFQWSLGQLPFWFRNKSSK